MAFSIKRKEKVSQKEKNKKKGTQKKKNWRCHTKRKRKILGMLLGKREKKYKKKGSKRIEATNIPTHFDSQKNKNILSSPATLQPKKKDLMILALIIRSSLSINEQQSQT